MLIKIDLDRMTVEDLEEIESSKIARIRAVLGKFVVNGNGEYLNAEEGANLIKKISVNEFVQQSRALMNAIKNEVPPVSGGN